jgi:hypothetical protein
MSEDGLWSLEDRCINATPGLGCNLGEMIFLAVAFWAASLVSAYFLIYTIRKSKSRCFLQDQTVLFWIFLVIWQLYHGGITLIDFHWNLATFRLVHEALNHILMFIPMCLVILILFELLFTYRDPGTNAIAFFRMLFILFLITFVILGVVLSIVDVAASNDAGESLSLWSACTDMVLTIFFALPARSLLDVVTAPMRQMDDVRCIMLPRIGIWLYVVLFGGRAIWNGSHYFRINVVSSWLADHDGSAVVFLPKENRLGPSWKARVVTFFFVLMFDFVTSLLAMASVYLFKKHDLMFAENPYYTRAES